MLLRAARLELIGLAVVFAAANVAAGAAAVPSQSIETAKVLMLNGQSREAKALLEQLAAADRNSNDIAFLLGLMEIEAGNYRGAIGHFRSILAKQPDALRVRLELARAFYLAHDYENAYRQFQLARAGRLPPGVGATIDRFVGSIRREKNWSYEFGVAIAPDTNINNGTSSREAIIFGLPFELSDETRQRSGTGLAVSASGEFAPRLGRNSRLRLGAAIDRREYAGTDFDDMTVALHAGPRFVLNRWDLSLLSTGFARHFGGHRLSEGLGARVEATHYRGAKSALSFGLAAQQVRYPRYRLQDGRAFSFTARAVRALNPASIVNAQAGVSRRTARSPDLTSWSGWAAAGYYRDLPAGFSIYAEPSFSYSRFDAADPFFARRRVDRVAQLQLAILNRRIVLSRFTPRVALTLARRRSTIDIYNFTQRRIEVGVTSVF